MSTPDLAIVAMAVVSLASIGRDYKVHMKVADRLRLVNPARQPEAPKPDAAAKPADDDKTGTVSLARTA